VHDSPELIKVLDPRNPPGILAVFILVLSATAGLAAEPAICGDFKRAGWPDPARLDRYALVETLPRGARDTGRAGFYNVDLDGDDESDSIEYSCSSSQISADPCLLTASLSTGKKLEFESWTMRLVRLKARIFIVSWPHPEVEGTLHEIFELNANGVRPVCGLSDAPEIPAQFRGKYAGSLSTCKNPGDGRLEILATTIRFYESRGRVVAIRLIDPLEIELDLELTGEGETWRDTRRLTLSKDKQVLTDITRLDPDYYLSRVRCEE
jgi:hypothetical protein